MERSERMLSRISIGANLRRRRAELGLTQEQVAEKISIAVPYYSNIERGARGMSIDVLCSLAATLGVSTDYILFGSENSSPLDNVIALLKDQPERFIILSNRKDDPVLSRK